MKSSLRDLLASQIHSLSQRYRHVDLPKVRAQLGLETPPTEADSGSKADRMAASFGLVSDADLPDIAQRLLQEFPPTPNDRNEIEELLWAEASSVPNIPKKHRRELAKALTHDDLFLDATRFGELLDRLWVLDDDSIAMILGGSDRSLRTQIDRHVYRNPGDWTPEHFFDQLGAYECTNRRFALFIEGLASADSRPDESEQRRFVLIVNESLGGCGVELRETGEEGGYPVFTLTSLNAGNRGRPKNLIFASADKPDLRFSDAVNNDIEIVTNAEKVLVYDRPIGAEGLRWKDLQAWWAETNGIDSDQAAKKSLYRRLQSSLPKNSPPQRLLFQAFFEAFGSDVPALPALLPEVWLHWDPKTVKERGVNALTRFRMDFLLLLPGNVRIVIEVDGKHHYAESDGRASVFRYATMAAADRELRLTGYDVYRFGAEELRGGAAKKTVGDFFRALFKRYTVVTT